MTQRAGDRRPVSPSRVASGDRRVLGALAAVLVAGCILCLVAWRAERATVGEYGLPLDDSWIHAQIARNLAQGDGWSFNSGVPVQNSSGPLWTALVALGFLVFGPGVWVLKIGGVLCYLGAILLVWRVVRAWSGDNLAAVAAAACTATSLPFAWHGLSGMETALAALLVLATIDTFQSWRAGWRRCAWPTFAALAAMTRPEALVLVPILAVERWWTQRSWREALLAAAVALAALLPYFALNVHLSGSIFPTTFGAKAGDTGLVSALRHRDGIEAFLALTLYPYAWTVHALAFWGLANVAVLLGAPLGAWVAARGPQRTLVPALVLLGLPALRGMTAPYGLPGAQQGRYIGVLQPLFYACGALGLVALVRGSPVLAFAARRTRIAAAAVLAIIAICWARLELRIPHVGEHLHDVLPGLWFGVGRISSFDGILLGEKLGLFLAVCLAGFVLVLGILRPGARRAVGLVLALLAVGFQFARLPRLVATHAANVTDIQRMDVALGRWVRAAVPPGTHIAVNDIGAIAYFGERPIVDAIGLATPELTPYWSPRRLRTLVAVRRFHPELCIVFPWWFPEWISRPALLEPLYSLRLPRTSIVGGDEARVYRCHWDEFSQLYSDSLLQRLDPPDAYAGLAGHLRRAMRNVTVPTRARLFTRAADDLRRRGDLAKSERYARRAVALDPRDLGAWLALYDALEAQKRSTDVREVLDTLVRALPEAPEALELRADWLSRNGAAAEALAGYEAALALHPDNVRLLGKAAKLWQERGDTERAQAALRRRLDLTWPEPKPLPAIAGQEAR